MVFWWVVFWVLGGVLVGGIGGFGGWCFGGGGWCFGGFVVAGGVLVSGGWLLLGVLL